MPVIAIVLIALIALVALGVWLTFSFFGLLVTLAVAAVVGWVADLIVPGELPFGWLGAILAGLLGSWLGTLILGHWGPGIAGIAIVPALIGAIILAFLAELITKSGRTRHSVA